MAITYEPVEPRGACGVGIDHIHTYMVCLKCSIIIIIIFIKFNWVVTRWQWLFYMYTKYEIGY